MLNSKTQNIKCGICGLPANFSFKEKHGEYSLYECPECGGQFWTPMKNPGAEWYEKDERYAFRNLNPLKKPEINHRLFLKENVALRQAQGKAKLLDIGMGTGNFLAAASAKGYDGYGIDFDQDAIASAQKNFGISNAYTLSVDGALAKFGERSFDVVTMFEVLEHMENPAESVKKIKKLLKQGGYLAISVPYRNAPDFLKPHDYPPRHLTRWNKPAMKKFLEDRGFSVVRMKVIPVSLGYLITKFHFWFKGIFSFGLVQKIASVKFGDERVNKIPLKIRLLQKTARLKDYVLFFLPASALFLFLWLIGRSGLGLYILGKKNNQ